MNNNLLDLTLGQSLWQQAEKNEEHFKLAFALAQGFDEYRNELVTSFALRIYAMLRDRLGNDNKLKNFYTCDNDETIKNVFYKKSFIGYRNELHGFTVGMTSETAGQSGWFFGITSPKNTDIQACFFDELRISINKTFSKTGGQTSTWFWWIWADLAYDNWNTQENLFSIAQYLRGQIPEPACVTYYVESIFKMASCCCKKLYPQNSR